MRNKVVFLFIFAMTLMMTSASASFNGREDFSEPRVVAISTSSSIGSTPWANASGYLYSPRIIFSAGHLKDNNEFKELYVSQPNQKLKDGMGVVKVIKKFFPATYQTRIYKDDFAIFILEKPLANVTPAPLITSELLTKAIAAKTPMRQIGFGAYEAGGGRTSLVPRSIEMTPWSASEIKSKYGRYDERVADHLFLTASYREGPCGGDSGGPTTVTINGDGYYVGTVASGFWSGYACGQSGESAGDTIGYTAPVYKFLQMIEEAEKYVAEHPYVAVKPVPSTSTKAAPSATSVAPVAVPTIAKDYQYILTLAKKWAKASKPSDTAIKQCTSARDKGVVYLKGKATPLGANGSTLRKDLNRYPGFTACLKGFTK